MMIGGMRSVSARAHSSLTTRQFCLKPAVCRAVSCSGAREAPLPALAKCSPISAWNPPATAGRSAIVARSSNGVASEEDVVRVATSGDMVTIHFTCRDEDGAILESSHDGDEGPITFELGAGEIMGNRLFQGFDEAVRGLAVGQRTILEASGGEWQRELLFSVPRDHPEVQRLEGRYKNQGGLRKDMIIELASGQLAAVIDITEEAVKIDANNMMAGKKLLFELELLDINKPPTEADSQEQ